MAVDLDVATLARAPYSQAARDWTVGGSLRATVSSGFDRVCQYPRARSALAPHAKLVRLQFDAAPPTQATPIACAASVEGRVLHLTFRLRAAHHEIHRVTNLHAVARAIMDGRSSTSKKDWHHPPGSQEPLSRDPLFPLEE